MIPNLNIGYRTIRKQFILLESCSLNNDIRFGFRHFFIFNSLFPARPAGGDIRYYFKPYRMNDEFRTSPPAHVLRVNVDCRMVSDSY